MLLLKQDIPPPDASLNVEFELDGVRKTLPFYEIVDVGLWDSGAATNSSMFFSQVCFCVCPIPAYFIVEPPTIIHHRHLSVCCFKRTTPYSQDIIWAGGLLEVPTDSVTVVQEQVTISHVALGVVAALAGLVALAAVLSIVHTYLNRKLPLIKMSSPFINMISSFGVIVTMVGIVLMGLGAQVCICPLD